VYTQSTTNLTKSVSEFLNSSEKSEESTNIITQDVKIVMKYARGCDISVNQTAKISIKKVTFDVEMVSSQASTDLAEKIKSDIKQAVKQTNDGISLGQVNVTNANQDIDNISVTDLKSVIENTFKEELKSFNKIAQKNELEIIECYDSNVDFSQYASIESVANRISKRILDNKVISDLKKETEVVAEQVAEQENKGLLGGNTMLYIAIAIVVLYFLYTMYGKGKGSRSRSSSSRRSS
jgi:hypothetical protein